MVACNKCREYGWAGFLFSTTFSLLATILAILAVAGWGNKVTTVQRLYWGKRTVGPVTFAYGLQGFCPAANGASLLNQTELTDIWFSASEEIVKYREFTGSDLMDSCKSAGVISMSTGFCSMVFLGTVTLLSIFRKCFNNNRVRKAAVILSTLAFILSIFSFAIFFAKCTRHEEGLDDLLHSVYAPDLALTRGAHNVSLRVEHSLNKYGLGIGAAAMLCSGFLSILPALIHWITTQKSC